MYTVYFDFLVLIYSSIFESMDSTRVALHKSQFRIILLYLILNLCADPLSETRHVTPISLLLNQHSSDW